MLFNDSLTKRNNISLYIILAILAMLITRHFGESWDELKFYKYADTALSAYASWRTQGTIELFGNTYDNYGPAYVMLVSLAAKPLQIIFTESDARHYIYFLTYLAGIWAFHQLAKRWLTKNAALFSTLLFATQPLFIGHAFISPKDIPFLSFFLLSLLFGLRFFDTLKPIQLNDLTLHSKRTLLVLSTLWLATVFGLFLFTESFHILITNLVQSAKAGHTNIISLIASDVQKVEPSIYIQRYFIFFLWTRSTLFLLSSFVLIYFAHRYFPLSTFHSLLSIIPSSLLLGFTTSIRILGPLAAVLVTYHALRLHRKHAITPLIIYAIIALITTYLTWPYLWLDPLGHFVESIKVMSQYPWLGQVLFNGTEYASTELPYSYLPVLLAVQLTEPVWILFAVGLFISLFQKEKREFLIYSSIWFFLPIMFFISSRSALYDNFRQIFFILPPVFIFAGIAFEKLFGMLEQAPRFSNSKLFDARVLMTLLLLPGIIASMHLHPYEYIYYNSYAGGVNGVFRSYELDYWGTSYREAANWINKNASPNANIWADGPSHLLAMYLRPDLKIYSSYETSRAEQYQFIVATSRYNLDLTSYPDAKIIHSIERDGAMLTVIKTP